MHCGCVDEGQGKPFHEDHRVHIDYWQACLHVKIQLLHMQAMAAVLRVRGSWFSCTIGTIWCCKPNRDGHIRHTPQSGCCLQRSYLHGDEGLCIRQLAGDEADLVALHLAQRLCNCFQSILPLCCLQTL